MEIKYLIANIVLFSIISSMNTLLAKKMNNQIKALVSSAVFDVFNDPDLLLYLSVKAKKRLSEVHDTDEAIAIYKKEKKQGKLKILKSLASLR